MIISFSKAIYWLDSFSIVYSRNTVENQLVQHLYLFMGLYACLVSQCHLVLSKSVASETEEDAKTKVCGGILKKSTKISKINNF